MSIDYEQLMRLPEAERIPTYGRTCIAIQRNAIATLLESEWVVAGATSRAWHAAYCLPISHEWRSAIILQQRGVSTFQLGVVRDVSGGGDAQLKSAVMSTLEAVIWLGLQEIDMPPKWELAL